MCVGMSYVLVANAVLSGALRDDHIGAHDYKLACGRAHVERPTSESPRGIARVYSFVVGDATFAAESRSLRLRRRNESADLSVATGAHISREMMFE
jgi:hypothetical protein